MWAVDRRTQNNACLCTPDPVRETSFSFSFLVLLSSTFCLILWYMKSAIMNLFLSSIGIIAFVIMLVNGKWTAQYNIVMVTLHSTALHACACLVRFVRGVWRRSGGGLAALLIETVPQWFSSNITNLYNKQRAFTKLTYMLWIMNALIYSAFNFGLLKN